MVIIETIGGVLLALSALGFLLLGVFDRPLADRRVRTSPDVDAVITASARRLRIGPAKPKPASVDSEFDDLEMVA